MMLKVQVLTLNKAIAKQLDVKWSLNRAEFEKLEVHGRVRGDVLDLHGELALASIDDTYFFMRYDYRMEDLPRVVVV